MRFIATVLTASGLAASAALASGSYATSVVSYAPGSNAQDGYTNPAVTLGAPERFTGEGQFPGAVTPFNSPYGTDEIVSIGAGGSLVLQFSAPVVNDPNNPFGIDLLIFGNQGYIDTNYPLGIAGPLFGGSSGGRVEVSADGSDWRVVLGAEPEASFPTLGYSDLTDPFAVDPGFVLSDYSKPVNPAFNPSGKTFAQIVAAYDGSGGGTGIDFASTGLSQISFVRIVNAGTGLVHVDAVSDVAAVPAPGAAPLLLLLIPRRRRVATAG